MSDILDFGGLNNKQELISLAVVIICPLCNTRIMAIGNALNDTHCPNCKRVYSPKTRRIMRECFNRNKEHKG